MYDESVYLQCFIYANSNIYSTRKKFGLHLAAEQELLPKCFAFNHVNYSRYLTFQLLNFSEIKHCYGNVLDDLLREKLEDL